MLFTVFWLGIIAVEKNKFTTPESSIYYMVSLATIPSQNELSNLLRFFLVFWLAGIWKLLCFGFGRQHGPVKSRSGHYLHLAT